MRVFEGTFDSFQQGILRNDLFANLERNFPTVVGHTVSRSEAMSWRGSLPRVEAAMRLAELPGDAFVTIEERIPYCSQRMDVCLFGHTRDDQPYSVIVELKGWSEATAREDGNVETFLGRGVQVEPHPSAQVRGYQEHLEDFRRAYQGSGKMGLASCAYCHNYSGIIPDDGLFHPQFDDLRTASPTFGEHDTDLFAKYLHCRLGKGRGRRVFEQYEEYGVGPSKKLIDYASDMIREQSVFRLLDNQLAANNAIVNAIREASRRRHKQVILVTGGPGTGKSVIALNAMGEVLRQEKQVFLVSGSSAFTHGMRRILGRRLEGLVRFTDFFWDAPPDSVDVLIVDEGHRVRAKSEPRVVGHLRPKVSQIEELIEAAKVTIFLVDPNQIISPSEVGDPASIRSAALTRGAHVEEFELVTQFRCKGSAAYLTWLDDVLALTDPPLGLRLSVPNGFDFRVAGSPTELWEEIEDKNRRSPNSARLLAGWCWPWSDPLPDGLVNDIQIGTFQFPWESKNGRRPPPGIPEAKHWAIDPAGVNQAGTVYSVQGFETRHVGVVLGPDLVIRDGCWVAQPKCNCSNGLRRQSPEVALPYLKRIYRTLMSRAMESCSVYSVDAETQTYLANSLVST